MTIPLAKIKLLNRYPFFGTILFNLPIIETESIPTMGVDGEVMYVNMKFWHSFDKDRNIQMGLLMHEAGHLFFKHLWRGRNYKEVVADPTSGQMIPLFNLAGDAVINSMLLREMGLSLPKGCFFDDKYIGWATEEVYEDLLKNMKKMTKEEQEQFMKNFMEKNGFCNKDFWKDAGKKKNARKQEEKWDRIIKHGLEREQKMKGDMPAWMKRLYESLEPKEDWRDILGEFVQPFNDDYSFSPPDRRYLEQDFSLPDINVGEKIDWLAIAVDTSGSISQKELSAFLGEVKGILEAFDMVKVKLTFCDMEASPFITLEEFDPSKIKVTGGGGTAFEPPFELVKKENDMPLAMLYFTDLYGSFPKQPDYPTIWITSSIHDKDVQKEVPFGKVLPYKV